MHAADRVAHQTTGDEVSIFPHRQPADVDVGEQVTFAYDLRSEIETDIFHPDWCLSEHLGAGLNVNVFVSADGEFVHSDEFCIVAQGQNNTLKRFDFDLIGSSVGVVDIQIEVVGSVSQELLGTHTTTLEVVSGDGGNGNGSVDPPDFPDDDNGIIDGPLLPCWADPNHTCGTAEAIAWAVGGAAVGLVVINRVTD